MNGHPSSLQLERFSVNDLAAEAQEYTTEGVVAALCGCAYP